MLIVHFSTFLFQELLVRRVMLHNLFHLLGLLFQVLMQLVWQDILDLSESSVDKLLRAVEMSNFENSHGIILCQSLDCSIFA